MTTDDPTIQGIKIVNGPSRERLPDRQLLDYEEYKRNLLTWLLNVGKNPEQADGYAETTVRQVSQKVDRFYRWHWKNKERYTTNLTPEDADAYIQHLVYSEK